MTNWFITGCSSGLGRALAEAVLERGWNAVITARDPARLGDIAARYPDTALAVGLNVADAPQVRDTVRRAEDRFGSIDVLVNNAGHGYRAAVEEAEEADVDELFATNFFGPVRLIKAVLPGMRAKRQGVVVNVSSIAARLTAPGSGYYSATKCALEGMSDGLRKEVSPLGIRVIVVEPGAFRTDFSGRSLLQSRIAIPDYAETAGLRRKENDHTHGRQPGDPVRAARVMIDTALSPEPPFRLLLGSDAVQIVGAELDAQRAELDAWKAVSTTTDFEN
jgi:NAD(P)-dependent dehydrogenase (short-subunit alcohol dehydrogenase family)